MPKFKKGNAAFMGATGQGKSDLPTDIPAKYVEGFLDGMDGRAEIVKTLRHRFRALVRDLGGDGLSYQEKSLCKRAVFLERTIEKTEATLVGGGMVDMNVYLSCINALSGVLSKIGLKRKPKQLPALADYLNSIKPEPPVAPSPAPSSEPQSNKEDAP